MEGTHAVGRQPFMPDSTLSRRSVALHARLAKYPSGNHKIIPRISLGAAAGSRAAPAPAAFLLRYCLDHLRNDQMLTPSSLARSFAGTPPVCNRCTAATLKFSSTFFRALLLGIS